MRSAVQGANPLDLGIIAAGVLAFILSLIPTYYTFSFHGLGDNFNAWHGFWGWFGVLLALAGALILAAELLMHIAMPFPVRLVVGVLFLLGLLCTVIAGFTWAGVDTHGLDVGNYTGHGVIYWLCLLVILVGTALAFLRSDFAKNLPSTGRTAR